MSKYNKKKYSRIGVDGNAFSVMGYVIECLKKQCKTEKEIKAYTEAAMSGDYDNLLQVSMTTLNKLNEERENEGDKISW